MEEGWFWREAKKSSSASVGLFGRKSRCSCGCRVAVGVSATAVRERGTHV